MSGGTDVGSNEALAHREVVWGRLNVAPTSVHFLNVALYMRSSSLQPQDAGPTDCPLAFLFPSLISSGFARKKRLQKNMDERTITCFVYIKARYQQLSK
jgi:hypothetical protein